MLYAFFYARMADSDTWQFFMKSKTETDWLLRDPSAFIRDLFSYGYQHSGGLFSGQDSYWNDLKSNLLVKVLAVFNVLTDKNYYADLVIFNLLFFLGPVALFRLMYEKFPEKKRLLLWTVFLIPSFLFWCSGLHKDGLIFSSIAMSMYFFSKQLRAGKIQGGPFAGMLVCLLLLFALRNFLFFLIIPALACWGLGIKFPARKNLVYVCTYLLGIFLFFCIPLIYPPGNFPQLIIEKQAEFKALGGNSQILLRRLDPDFFSFLRFLPAALDMIFLQPHINSVRNFSYIPAIAENLLLLCLLLFSVLVLNKEIGCFSPLMLFCLFFSLSVLLIAGYTITLSAAIMRYKSVVLPLLVTPLLAAIDQKKLIGIIGLRSSKST